MSQILDQAAIIPGCYGLFSSESNGEHTGESYMSLPLTLSEIEACKVEKCRFRENLALLPLAAA